MCILCNLMGFVDLDYLEVSAGALDTEVAYVGVFGMLAEVPPFMLAYTQPGGYMSPFYYN